MSNSGLKYEGVTPLDDSVENYWEELKNLEAIAPYLLGMTSYEGATAYDPSKMLSPNNSAIHMLPNMPLSEMLLPDNLGSCVGIFRIIPRNGAENFDGKQLRKKLNSIGEYLYSSHPDEANLNVLSGTNSRADVKFWVPTVGRAGSKQTSISILRRKVGESTDAYYVKIVRHPGEIGKKLKEALLRPDTIPQTFGDLVNGGVYDRYRNLLKRVLCRLATIVINLLDADVLPDKKDYDMKSLKHPNIERIMVAQPDYFNFFNDIRPRVGGSPNDTGLSLLKNVVELGDPENKGYISWVSDFSKTIACDYHPKQYPSSRRNLPLFSEYSSDLTVSDSAKKARFGRLFYEGKPRHWYESSGIHRQKIESPKVLSEKSIKSHSKRFGIHDPVTFKVHGVWMN